MTQINTEPIPANDYNRLKEIFAEIQAKEEEIQAIKAKLVFLKQAKRDLGNKLLEWNKGYSYTFVVVDDKVYQINSEEPSFKEDYMPYWQAIIGAKEENNK
jgi:hypothetical protein